LATSALALNLRSTSGAKLVEPVEMKPWGRQFTVDDLDGNQFFFHRG
jgi:hypothetical protein